MKKDYLMIRLSPALKRRIEETARAQELSMSAWIRTALMAAMDGKRGPGRPASKPAGRATLAQVRERLEAILREDPSLNNDAIWSAYNAQYGDDCAEADYMRALRGLADLRR